MEQSEFISQCKLICSEYDFVNNGFYLQFISAEYRKEAITLLCVGFKIEKTYHIIRKTKDIILIGEDGTNLRKLYLNDIISQARAGLK